MSVIAVDFDGTVVTHDFPDIGDPCPMALETLRELAANGHRIVLWTMRSDGGKHGDVLTAAVKYLEDNGVELHGVNHNPEQDAWTSSPKAYASVYIDDAALGVPLRRRGGHSRPEVDWLRVRAALCHAGMLTGEVEL